MLQDHLDKMVRQVLTEIQDSKDPQDQLDHQAHKDLKEILDQ